MWPLLHFWRHQLWPKKVSVLLKFWRREFKDLSNDTQMIVIGLRGERTNYKIVAMDDFWLSCLGLPYYPGLRLWPCLFYWRLHSLPAVVTIFGKSRDQNKNLKNSHSLHLSLIRPEPTVRVRSDAKSVEWSCWDSHYWKSYYVTKCLWLHGFFTSANLKKSIL